MVVNINKQKGAKKYIIKKEIKFKNHEDCLLNNEIILKSQQRFEREADNVYTESIRLH